MIVPDKLRRCVAFIGYQMADNSFRMAGSVFFLGQEQENGKAEPVYAITARHVIDGIRSLGLDKVWLRVNFTDGQARWMITELDQWFYDPDQYTDVAILKTGLDSSYDHLVYPYGSCANKKTLVDNEVGLGDEVFITGLFRHHHGNTKNIPIVRVGNIASMNEEEVQTKWGKIDAYLIEARSIGGLSGSPVFLNLGITRYINNSVQQSTGGPMIFLLGLIHGHYDIHDNALDNAEDDAADPLNVAKVNTGIGIVVPMHTVFEVIEKYEQ